MSSETDQPQGNDASAAETREWLDSLDYVIEHEGPEQAVQLLRRLQVRAQEAGIRLPFTANTPYVNTISVDRQPAYPGKREIERRIKSIIRWNAMAMVVRANREESGIGGHISTYASAATLYEVGYNHFFRVPGRIEAETSSIFKDMPRRATMRGRFWRAGFPRRIYGVSAGNCVRIRGCHRTRIRG